MARVKVRAPAFQYYPRDFLSDPLVIAMTPEQECAYRRLVDFCWLEGGLPTNLAEIWPLAKARDLDSFAREIWPVVGRKFQRRRDKFHHKRLDRERAHQAKTRKERQLAAAARWGKVPSKRTAIASGLQSSATASSTASSTADHTSEKSTAAARRVARAQLSEGTFGLYCVIAREARQISLERDGSTDLGNVREIFKALCGQRGLVYSGGSIDRALDAVLAAEAAAHTAAPADVGPDWFDECRRIHNGECALSKSRHLQRLQIEAYHAQRGIA